MDQNVNFSKVMTLQGHNKWHHQIPWLKNIDLDTKIVTLSALVQKISFGIMVANVTHLRTSHVQITQDIFSFIERP